MWEMLQKPYIIAEISGNHGGRLDRAIELIRAAHNVGADAVKFQTYEAGTITIDHDGPDFTVRGDLWSGRKLYDLYKEAQTPFAWHEALFEEARRIGITPFSSPFDETAIALLENLKAPFYKIASCELVDVGLIAAVAQTGKPVIMSTGMASIAEIEEAVSVFRANGSGEICLLHCISGYPTPASQAHLSTITDMRSRFGVSVGLSDHSKGIVVPVAATALGVSVIEKHIKLDDGPAVDGEFSLNPVEFKEMVTACRMAASAIGQMQYGPQVAEKDTLRFRRSLYIVKSIESGERLTEAHVKSIRPGKGLHPRYLPQVLGRKLVRSLHRGTPLSLSDLAED